MPFKSDAQRRFMFSQHPGLAARWNREAHKEGVAHEDLPEKVTDSNPAETKKKSKREKKDMEKKAFMRGLKDSCSKRK